MLTLFPPFGHPIGFVYVLRMKSITDVAFKECFSRYLLDHELVSVESIQAGMMTELRYLVHLKESSKTGEFVAALQQLNGNNRVLLTTARPARQLSAD
jgi:hypothetical protein